MRPPRPAPSSPSGGRPSRPRLQLALDAVEVPRLEGLVRAVEEHVQIVELGTPAIVRDGVGPLRALRAAFPGLTLLADVKIADGGHLEATLAFEAGADIVTVLALADDATVREAVRAAEEQGGEVMADLLGVRAPARRARELEALGVHYVCLHTPLDVQRAEGLNAQQERNGLRRVRGVLRRAGLAVAGGLTALNVAAVAALGADVVVVGSAIASAADPGAAALAVRRALDGGGEP